MDIRQIIEAIRSGKVRVTDHADEEAHDDGLTLDQVERSALNGEIIEDYPTEKPYPSCLVLGPDDDGHPIHSVWGYNALSGWAVLITVYRPDPDRWVGWRQRKT